MISATRNNAILAGHHAWLAWRAGNLSEAEIYGRTAVEAKPGQRSEGAPFLWVGLWPLIGVALAQAQPEVAINNVRKLLDPTQQPPPPAIQTFLEAALQSWDAGQQTEALAVLQQAVPLAREMGYL
jgi:hypothetical protein